MPKENKNEMEHKKDFCAQSIKQKDQKYQFRNDRYEEIAAIS